MSEEMEKLQEEKAKLQEKIEALTKKADEKPDYAGLLESMKSELAKTMAELTKPIKEKEIHIVENKAREAGVKVEPIHIQYKHISPITGAKYGIDYVHKSGKYAGLRQSDLEFTQRICKAFKIPMSETLMKTSDMVSTTDGSGDDWVPSDLDNQLWDEWVKQSAVAQLFRVIEMPTQPYDLPIKTSGMTIYKTAEDVAPTASGLGTGYGRLDACKLAGKITWTYELDEDSILPMIGIIREDIAEQMAAAIDNVIINGDTTTGTANINLSGGTIGTTNKVLCFNGLRHAALVDNGDMDSDLGTLAAADFATLLGLLGKYSTRPSRLAFLIDPYTRIKALQLDELETVEKFGSGASILTGEFGKIYGIPVITTEEIAKTNATGWVDNSAGSNTKGQIICVHKPSWITGYKRRVLIETDKDIDVQQYELVVSTRFALAGYGDGGDLSSQGHTAVGFNVTV